MDYIIDMVHHKVRILVTAKGMKKYFLKSGAFS